MKDENIKMDGIKNTVNEETCVNECGRENVVEQLKNYCKRSYYKEAEMSTKRYCIETFLKTLPTQMTKEQEEAVYNIVQPYLTKL